MSEPKLISPMLDNFVMGDAISNHHGISCYPAMENGTDNKYIVKVISVPASPAQMDALLLTGAYSDEETALGYFKDLAEDVVKEVNILKVLSQQEGFLPYKGCQIEPMDSGKGYDIYLLGDYKRSLTKHFQRHAFTHLDVLNLGLDICAALSACRRAGYLYVDLKPCNIFVSEQRQYRIGDLGFVRMDSLKYASLPAKYISDYTAPEITDAFSSLSATMDTYAAGLILYQAYNNGALPFRDGITPGSSLPAPLYADYEMSEIILKACHPDPEQRWQDPMQLGQAIVSYMQRNGVSDTPIIPVPVPEETQPEAEDTQAADAVQEDAAPVETADNDEPVDTFTDEETDEQILLDDAAEISEDVSEILSQADALAAMEVPDPVVVPDHVDVPMPEIVTPEEPEIEEQPEPESEEEAEETVETPTVETDDPTTEEEVAVEMPEDEEADEELIPPTEKKTSHWLRNTILVVLLLALLAGGYFYYTNYYLLPIDSISAVSSEDSLTVIVSTTIDESLLQVMCTDAYGNQTFAPVEGGKAEFTGLVPNTAYTVKLVANGFHRLTGNTSTAFSTPVQTNIVQFDAVTGIADGSVILRFTVEGPDSAEWNLVYFAAGEKEQTTTFNSHLATLTDLAIGKEYTFRLEPVQDLYVTGQDQITFTPSKIITAENLEITSCVDNTLTVVWDAPEGENVVNWSVHCSGVNYNQTIITTDTTAIFQDIDTAAGYEVEIKAIGMSVGRVVSIPENTSTVTGFAADTSDPRLVTFTWDTNAVIPQEGWTLRYTITGIEGDGAITCYSNSVAINPCIPNAEYTVQLEDENGNPVLGSRLTVSTGDTVDFQRDFVGFSADRDDLVFSMCKTPNAANWDRTDLDDSDYRTSFAAGEKASFLVRFRKTYSATAEEVNTMFVIRTEDGKLILTAQQVESWRDMWYRNYCEMDIPVMPETAGDYTIEVYFDGELVHTQPFTITE